MLILTEKSTLEMCGFIQRDWINKLFWDFKDSRETSHGRMRFPLMSFHTSSQVFENKSDIKQSFHASQLCNGKVWVASSRDLDSSTSKIII